MIEEGATLTSKKGGFCLDLEMIRGGRMPPDSTEEGGRMPPDSTEEGGLISNLPVSFRGRNPGV